MGPRNPECGDYMPRQHRLSRLSQALDSQMRLQLERALHMEVRVGVWKGNVSHRGPAEVWKGRLQA